MNQPEYEDQGRNESDRPVDPLDEVIFRLRHEPIPPVPGELSETPLSEKEARSGSKVLRRLSFPIAVAATLMIAVSLPRIREPSSPDVPPAPTETTNVSVVPVAHLNPYQGLESDLEELRTEITELRRRAELLDVFRRTESLLARN